MNKILLTLFAIATFGGIATANIANQSISAPKEWKLPAQLMPLETATHSDSRADEQAYVLDFVGDIYSFTCLVYGEADYRVYQYISPEWASKMAGDKLTDIYYSVALLASSQLSGSIFVTEDPNGAPVTETATTIKDCYNNGGSEGNGYQIASLAEPYTIKEGQGFYYGFTVKGCAYDANSLYSCDFPIAFDNLDPTEFSGEVDVTVNGQTSHYSMGKDFGTNLCIKARTYGKGLPNYFIMEPVGLTGGFAFPMIENDSQAQAWVYVENRGANDITSVEYEYSVNGASAVKKTATVNIQPTAINYFALPYDGLENGINQTKFTITKANGVDVNTSGDYRLYKFGENSPRYTRKTLVEEGTGTWCGYCPRGIYGMDYMEEKYPNDFLGIAVHASSSSAVDPFECESYLPLINEYIYQGFPGCVVNREPYFALDPLWSTLEKAHLQFMNMPTFVGLELSGMTLDDKAALVKVDTKFGDSEKNANYKLAFAVLEDGLSTQQQNYYSKNDPNGEAGEWVNRASKHRWTYSNTAMDIFYVFGLEGLLPTEIEGGKTYSTEYKVSLENARKTANTSIVAMVLDGATGVVLNSEKISYASLAGINDAIMPSGEMCQVYGDKGCIIIEGEYENATVFNLSGQRVGLSGLEPGIYLVTIDGSTHKVSVK